MDTSIIGKYDIRGKVGENLFPIDAYTLGIKFSKFLLNRINADNLVNNFICVGYDGRKTSFLFEQYLCNGICASGLNVVRVGLCTSPMLYFATQATNALGGIIITASHNPPEYNGFKFFLINDVICGNDLKKIFSCNYSIYKFRTEEEYVSSINEQTQHKPFYIEQGTYYKENINAYVLRTDQIYNDNKPKFNENGGIFKKSQSTIKNSIRKFNIPTEEKLAIKQSVFQKGQTYQEFESTPIIKKSKTGAVVNSNICHRYIEMILKCPFKNNSRKKIVWDCNSGATGSIIHAITKMLNFFEHVVINDEIDGLSKNKECISDVIEKQKCDLGISFDGDGDRVYFFDKLGNKIHPDHIMIVFISSLLKEKPNAKILADVKTSGAVFDFLGDSGIIHPTGHSLIKKKMIENKEIALACEASGHFIFRDIGFDDGIYAAIKFLSILDGRCINEMLKTMPTLYITPEIKIKSFRSTQAIDLIKKKLEHDGLKFLSIDGVRVNITDHNQNNSLSTRNWWLARYSNTEDYIIVRCEGQDATSLKKSISNLLGYLNLVNLTLDENIILKSLKF